MTDRELFEDTFGLPCTIQWSKPNMCYLHDGKIDHESEKWDAALAAWQMRAQIMRNELGHILVDVQHLNRRGAVYRINRLRDENYA